MRLAMEREFMYARQYPFMEYGVDLTVMSVLEKGVYGSVLTRTPYDVNPPKNQKKWIDYKLSKYHSRKGDRIPLKVEGSGGKRYHLYE